MAKINLTDEDLRILSESINNQTEIPEELLLRLSPGFFEKLRQAGKFDYRELDKYKIPTIEYAGKRAESVILQLAAITGGAAPLQVVRSFANGKNGDWKNLIVQGDNLQFLKTCYLNHDPLIKNKIKGKVKLIYIDPPFATESDFAATNGAQSYADKVGRAEFIEALRERIIYMKEILSNDGSLYLHLDARMSHYGKVMLDEIFGKENFRNEIIWFYPRGGDADKQFNRKHDAILWYSKDTSKWTFNWKDVLIPYTKEQLERFKATDEKGQFYWNVNPRGERCKTYLRKEGIGEYDVWNIGIDATAIKAISYPTAKPEQLLKRILLASSNPNDLIFDCFAGSGTTAAVAEKLGRRWIVCDFGKHAIYTMQKRILNIADSKKLGNGGKNEKYDQPPKPFCVVSAGAYDFSKIMNLRKNKDAYISFVLGLFGISKEDVDFSKKYKLSNIYAEKENDPVEVYPVWEDEYLKDIRIDEGYLKDILEASGGKLKGDYYIVVPETCTVISDTTLKNRNNEKVNFKLLKFPYKVLEDVSRHFQIEEQASSETDINRLISSAGFYFNEEVKIEVEKMRVGIKINKFKTEILDKNKERFKGLEGLSMILIDVNYDGKIFDMDIAIYSKEIDENDFIKVEGITKDSHLIAIDKHGNESKITKIG